MGMKPTVETQEATSQATPLAQDVLGMIRRQITGGVFGEGMGPLQQEAGTAIRQYVTSRQNMDQFAQTLAPVLRLFDQGTNEQVAGLRTSMGSLGGRFGTPLANAEADFRSDRSMQRDALIAQAWQQEMQNLLAGIAMMQQFGLQNIAPALQMAQLGILPEHVIVGDSPFAQITGAAAGLMKGAGSLRNPFASGE